MNIGQQVDAENNRLFDDEDNEDELMIGLPVASPIASPIASHIDSHIDSEIVLGPDAEDFDIADINREQVDREQVNRIGLNQWVVFPNQPEPQNIAVPGLQDQADLEPRPEPQPGPEPEPEHIVVPVLQNQV